MMHPQFASIENIFPFCLSPFLFYESKPYNPNNPHCLLFLFLLYFHPHSPSLCRQRIELISIRIKLAPTSFYPPFMLTKLKNTFQNNISIPTTVKLGM